MARHVCIPPARSGLVHWCAIGLFLDDVPRPGEEDDPVALAEARTRTFSWRSKVLLGSTPTIHGISRIEREYEASDQRRYFVPCPHCGHMQWLEFERLRWDKGMPETAHYLCEACDGRIEEHHKTATLQAGEWRATADGNDTVAGMIRRRHEPRSRRVFRSSYMS